MGPRMEVFFSGAEVAGGVVLFLVGMQGLSAALRAAAGDRLRGWLTAVTRSRIRGLLLGTAAGAMVHSSAATVMTVGFAHAGMLSLATALPVVIGANIGTTLSMQMISLRLTDFALLAVALGGLLALAAAQTRWETTGRAILGFGLLFLGMKISGDALVPYRDDLAPLLAAVDGSTLGGLLAGVLVSAAITALVQSSGAVIGMTFVLARAGVFTSLEQTYPVVLGAHIGTTITAVLASIGASPEARRTAVANTLFNVFNTGVGLAGAAVFIPFLVRTSDDLVHQTANAHSLIMIVAAVLALPATPLAARLLRTALKSREPELPGSFLDARLLGLPEDALAATVRELGRCTGLCRHSLELVKDVFRGGDSRQLRRVLRNEASINEIKVGVRAYLRDLARGHLSRRQALTAQALNRCVVELERVGDHIESLVRFLHADGGRLRAQLDEPTAEDVTRLAELAGEVVDRVAKSFDPGQEDFDAVSWAILEARNAYARESAPVRAKVNERLSGHEVPARMILSFGDYAVALDRVVRHCATIAQEQRQPAFAIERARLGHPAGPPVPL